MIILHNPAGHSLKIHFVLCAKHPFLRALNTAKSLTRLTVDEILLSKDVVGVEDSFGGTAPFRTGVLGGSVLSMYSGEMYGPNETRFPEPPDARCAGIVFRAERELVAGKVRRGVADSDAAYKR